MNTANPQLEGLYLATSAILNLLIDKQVITREELRAVLSEAEDIALNGGALASDSDSHRKAMAFPVRFLLMAQECAAGGENLNFREIARRVALQN